MLTCDMLRVSIVTGGEVSQSVPFPSRYEINLESTDVGEMTNRANETILENITKYNNEGSSWRVSKIFKIDINMINYTSLSAGSYIKLSKTLEDKKAVVNMLNDDNECFKWRVTRALNMKKNHPERIDKELIEKSKELHWEGIEFPVTVSSGVFAKFEKNNKDISVNVYGINEEKIYPLHTSKNFDQKHHIDLLLISNKETNHYCLIKNFSRIVSAQSSSHEHKTYYCRNCLQGYHSKETLAKHFDYCRDHISARIELPKEGSFLKFHQAKRKMRVPFVIYADFESFIKPINTCAPNTNTSYTKQYQKHTPSSYCYYIKCFDESVYKSKLVTYTATNETDDVAQLFVDSLEKEVKRIYNKILKLKKNAIKNQEDIDHFNAATTCHICEEELEDDKIWDHCHFTGKYRGAAHNDCNLNYKIHKFLPILFHNMSGYDSHLFIKKLSGDSGKLTCIPNKEEKYISFSKEIKVGEFIDKDGKTNEVNRELRFIDSFRFMGSSLDSLSKNLTKDQFENTKSYYSGKQLDLLLRKGVYPYDWVDSIDKFSETQLPPQESFYSKLCDEGISDEDYLQAQEVWKVFNCQTFRDYHNIYNVSDVLILADVFENFRDVCNENYGLDPAHYLTEPGLAWDAALKLTKIELELISDYDMLLMIKKGTRGGISMISNRYGVANNKYMGDSYDPSKESTYIQYLDANNLYGWAMSKPLPTQEFEWMSESELDNWKSMPCILEVDLDYPDHLHDMHNDYPLAPERMNINKVEKLVPNLNNKKNYVIHYENLKQYEELGLKITKIHRGIKFDERDWLKEYINLNTSLRTKATNDFEKDFFKLMNNSVFGKTMENIENHVDVRLVSTAKQALKLSKKTNFERRTIFDENLIALHMKRTKLYYNKPIYLGMSILDLRKTLMYDFHYNYIKEKYDHRAKLLMTDTDSLIYEIKTDDFYKDIAKDVEYKFDTSEFSKDHPSIREFRFKVEVNKKVIGMFKDETGGKQIEEFVGLRSKLYSYKLHEKEHKRCKGVKKSVVAKTITHEDYKNCLMTKNEQLRTMNVIRSRGHELYTEQINKVALSSNDDKRIILEDGMHTLAYGHWRTER